MKDERRLRTRPAAIAIVLAGCACGGEALGAMPPTPLPAPELPPIRSAARTDSATTPGALSWETTFRCAGFKWTIDGDADIDCAVAVRYREAAGGGAWQEAQPLLRVLPSSYHQYEVDPGNLLAGSIFSLAPGTSYEIALSLVDPDGGAAAETLLVTTRAIPAVPPGARMRYVVPGAGGGSGTEVDPFLGLAAADADAQPGDFFLLSPGVYAGSVALTASGTEAAPIIWHGEDRATVILDGEDTWTPVVELPGTRHVHLENLTVRRPRQYCLGGSGTVGLVVRDCLLQIAQIDTVDMTAIYLCGEAHRDDVISGNTLEGPLQWEDGRTEDHYGIRLIGTGHVVEHNRIHDWWDGIQIGADVDSVETSACDVYGNEIYRCTDDAIEADASRHNIRIFENRMTNVLTGISCQPVHGGPVYMIRNVIYNWQLKPMKFHLWPTGLLVYNNTLFGAYPNGWYAGRWKNGRLRNNLVLGGSHAACGYTPVALYDQAFHVDLDYDGFYQPLPDRFADWIHVVYPTLESFQAGTGFETHAVLVDSTVFVAAGEPALGGCVGAGWYPPPYEPGAADLRLREEAVAVDAGVFLANVTEGFDGAAPDLGAYELHRPLPSYGPEGGETSGSGPGASGRRSALLPCRPNPFRAVTEVRFQLAERSRVAIEVFDVAGRAVRRLMAPTQLPVGFHAVRWDGRRDDGTLAPTGLYFCRVRLDGRAATGRVIRIG